MTELKRKRSRALALSLTCKDIARHQPFADQEGGSHQELNQPHLDLGLSNFHDYEKEKSVVLATQSILAI